MIERSDAPAQLSSLLLEPAFESLQAVAKKHGVDIVLGVYWKESLGAPPTSTMVLLGRDGRVQMPGWTSDLKPIENSPLEIGDAKVVITTAGETRHLPQVEAIHIIGAAGRPEGYQSALDLLDRALAVNWHGDRFSLDMVGIDFIDVPLV
jgi:hypothetical protein